MTSAWFKLLFLQNLVYPVNIIFQHRLQSRGVLHVSYGSSSYNFLDHACMQMSPRPDSNIRISVIEHFGSIFKCWICIYINFRLGLAPSSGDASFGLKPETV